MGRKKKNTKPEAQYKSSNRQEHAETQPENASLSVPLTVCDHQNTRSVHESLLLQHAQNCSSVNSDTEKISPFCGHINTVENVISHPTHKSDGKMQDIHLRREGTAEVIDESQNGFMIVTKNKKGKKHKNKKNEKEKMNECVISGNLEDEKASDENNEREKNHTNAINSFLNENSAHLEEQKCMKQKTKKTVKENDALFPEMQELKKDNALPEILTLSNDEKPNCEASAVYQEAFSEPIKKHHNTSSELIVQIRKHSEALQHEDQDKPEDQGPSLSNISRSLSQEQITNITKTAVNLSQSLGENEKSKISFMPELMQSLLSPTPKDTSTREDELEYKLIQREIFLNYACHVCKAIQCTSSILKRCNNCKMISYCSKEHQREHWPIHKDLCKVISKITKAEGMNHLYQKAIGLSPDEYRHYRIHYINICANLLGRELELWEKEMFFFAQVCHTCYEFQINILKICEKCNNVCYCQPSHFKADHDTWCNDLEIYRDLIIYQFHRGMIQPNLPQIIHQRYLPLNGEMKSFLFNTFIGTDQILDANRLQYVTLTELATCPLSVLFALQQSSFCLETCSSLIIHVVGAELHFEGNVLDKWETFLLHLLPNIITLHIVFIGPELQLDNALAKSANKNLSCLYCAKNGKKLIFSFWAGYYHDYVLCDQYEKPNLITAFNNGLYRTTGFQGKDSWLPSLEVMLHDAKITLVITEYTSEELPLDIKRMEKICSLNILVPPSKNPFCSAKPSLNFLSDETVPVIFKNYYITVLHRK